MNSDYILHPNTNGLRDYHCDNKLEETGFHSWHKYIGIYKWDSIPNLPFNFSLCEKTEEEINWLLLDWYWKDWEGNQYVTFSWEKYTDNRPLLEELW